MTENNSKITGLEFIKPEMCKINCIARPKNIEVTSWMVPGETKPQNGIKYVCEFYFPNFWALSESFIKQLQEAVNVESLTIHQTDNDDLLFYRFFMRTPVSQNNHNLVAIINKTVGFTVCLSTDAKTGRVFISTIMMIDIKE